MMLAFVLIAGALTAAAAVLLIRPLLKRREDGRPPDAITALVMMFLLFASGSGLYAWFTHYSWVDAPAVADTPAARAAKLSKEQAEHPSVGGLVQLGELYFDLEQYPLAIRAYQRADRLAGGKSVAALSGVAESMLAEDFERIRGTAGRLFERVLEMEPDNPKALLYGALAAMGRGENATARERFHRMLAQNPPPQIRAIIEKQLQSLDAAELAPAAEAAQIQVRIDVAPALRYRMTDKAALFVAARDPAQPGPPFAAKRLPVGFPVDVTLTAADAMLPQRHISQGQKLEVVARISLTGQPTGVSGDPVGQVGYHVGKDGKLNILIDKLSP